MFVCTPQHFLWNHELINYEHDENHELINYKHDEKLLDFSSGSIFRLCFYVKVEFKPQLPH